ncbi:MAG: BamA/TamA family outer membrane protein [Cytophagales bacterium]
MAAESFGSILGTDSVQNDLLIVRDIRIEGNKRTRPQIIYRELAIRIGDSISQDKLSLLLEKEVNKIFNTQLFNIVEVDYVLDGEYIDIWYTVIERWYIWPSFHLDLGDRNFNEWLLQRGAGAERLVYGLTFRDKNFRGRRENIKLKFQLGFTRKFEAFYDIPYVNKNRKTGMGFKVSYSDNNTVAFQVNDHKLEFVDSDELQRRRFYSTFYLVRRSEFYGQQSVELNYHQQWVGDTISALNPNYFGDSASRVEYFNLSYSYSWDRRNIAYYATKGYIIGVGIGKAGLGLLDDIDVWEMRLQGAKYFELGKKFYSSHYASTKISAPNSQPFFLYQGLGYGDDILRGFDLYVINGNHYVINKNELKYELFSFKKTFNFIPLDQFKVLPVKVFIKVFADLGYVDNRNTRDLNARFSNTFLSGYGIGIDVATFYDLVFRTEYAISQEGETNLFLNLQAAF